jgi:hypothetical protein
MLRDAQKVCGIGLKSLPHDLRRIGSLRELSGIALKRAPRPGVLFRPCQLRGASWS